MTGLRTYLRLLDAQLEGIRRFHLARVAAEAAVEGPQGNREAQMDAARRLEVVRRQHEAVVARTAQRLRETNGPMPDTSPRTLLVAHHHEWVTRRVTQAIGATVDVLAVTANGAEAVGIAVAEQPDLVLVDELLAMQSGAEVVREVVDLCPDTVVVAQVGSEHRVAELRAAGAHTVLTRSVLPEDVAGLLRRILGVPGDVPLLRGGDALVGG